MLVWWHCKKSCRYVVVELRCVMPVVKRVWFCVVIELVRERDFYVYYWFNL